MKRFQNRFKRYLATILILALLAAGIPVFGENEPVSADTILPDITDVVPSPEVETPSIVETEKTENPLLSGARSSDDSEPAYTLKVDHNDPFLICQATLPEGVNLKHIDNADEGTSWSFSLSEGSSYGTYSIPINFHFIQPMGAGSSDYFATLTLDIHYEAPALTTEEPEAITQQNNATVDPFNGRYTLRTTRTDNIAGCRLNLPAQIALEPGEATLSGPSVATWSAKVLPGTETGSYDVPVSAGWVRQSIFDTGSFGFSFPIQYTAPEILEGEPVYQITEAGKDYYLVGFGDTLKAAAPKEESLRALAAISDTEAEAFSEDIDSTDIKLQATEATGTPVPFALVTEAGATSGTVYQYKQGARTAWEKTKQTLQLPTVSTQGKAYSRAAAKTDTHAFPPAFYIRKLNLEDFRLKILVQVAEALGNNGVEIPVTERENIEAGVFHGVDLYGFGNLAEKANPNAIKPNLNSVYYLYARHMTGLALTSYMAGKAYGGSQNGYEAIKAVKKGYLGKCGYMTPEATLGLKNGREYTADEFYIMGQIGQNLGMDYIGELQLKRSLLNLQSDYSMLKKMSSKWVMVPQGGTWYKITLPKDPNNPKENLQDIYVSAQDENGNAEAIIAPKDASRGQKIKYMSGSWEEQGIYFAAVPVDTTASISSTGASSQPTAAAIRAGEIPVPVKVVTIITETVFNNYVKQFKINLKKSPAITLAGSQGILGSVDDNIFCGYLKWKGIAAKPPGDSSPYAYYYWQAKAYTDAAFYSAMVTAWLGSAAEAGKYFALSGLSLTLLVDSLGLTAEVTAPSAAILAGMGVGCSGISFASKALAERSYTIMEASNGKKLLTKGFVQVIAKLRFAEGYAEHLRNVIKFDRNVSKGITGGHNLVEFKNYFKNVEGLAEADFIEKIVPHPSIAGIYEITYKVPLKDKAGKIIPGKYKVFDYPKTVYDPSIISDTDILKWGQEAITDGLLMNRIEGRTVSGTASNGLKFFGWINPAVKDFIEITNFYPVLK